jgi:hypothetical protein
MKKLVVVVAPVLESGKKKIDFQNSKREKVTRKCGCDKVTFLHCDNFLSGNKFCEAKIKGAVLIINATKKAITHPNIPILTYSEL